jgi:hypothetical protein
MTPPDRDYDEVLRRALNATVDAIEPASGGLARIRKRLDEPWLKRQLSLLLTECADFFWLIIVHCQLAAERLRGGLGTGARAGKAGIGTGARAAKTGIGTGARAAKTGIGTGARAAAPGFAWLRAQAARLAAWVARTRHRRRQQAAALGQRQGSDLPPWVGYAMGWLRPALAVGGAVVIVVAGVYALAQIRQTIISQANVNPVSGHSQTTGGAQAQSSSPLSTGIASPIPASRGGPVPGHEPSSSSSPTTPTATCSPSPSPSPSPTWSPSPSPSPTETPSPSPSPTDTPTPTTGTDSTPGPAESPEDGVNTYMERSIPVVTSTDCTSASPTSSPSTAP